MSYPLGATHRNEVADGVSTETIVTLQSNGELQGTVHTWTKNKLKGAHAVASVVIFDANKNPLWILDPPVKCGVAGRWDPSGPSNRYESIHAQIPVDAMARAAYLSIVNTRQDYSIFAQWVNEHLDPIIVGAIEICSVLAQQEAQPL
jgi:hypothetical protein